MTKKAIILNAVLLTFLSAFCLYAQTRGHGEFEIVASNGAVVGRFTEAHALVIGESEYPANSGWRRLPGVKDDVVAIKALFENDLGFNVKTIQNANSRDLKNGIQDFLDEYGFNPNSRLIVYFAGHGATLTLQTGSKLGYIVPVDVPHPDRDEIVFKQRAISMDQFHAWARNYDSRHILFIFDSCFSGTVFRSGSSTPPPAINNLIAQPVRQFITSGDADEEVPDESVFRKELVAALRYGLADPTGTGYVSGTQLGLYLYNTVHNLREGKQNPTFGKLNDTNLNKGDFVFAIGRPIERPVPSNMVRIPGGTFTMGSPANEPERFSDEGPQRRVTLSSFYMGKYEVTQKEYREVMGTNPSNFKGDNLPVENVTWFDAVDYCNALSRKEGLTPAYTVSGSGDSRTVTPNWSANGYRLPTEAEWEYACRAGTTTPFSTGNNVTTNQANYNGNNPYNNNAKGTYRERTTPVGSFAANAWGLYDMHGNVWEWCWDWYESSYTGGQQTDPKGPATGSYRVIRGGSWSISAQYVRSAYRFYFTPSSRYIILGFRLVRP